MAILHRGRIEQLGSPAEAYDAPASPFVYSFVGAVNRLPARWESGALHAAGLPLAAHDPREEGEAEVFVRPEDLRLVDDGKGWPATIIGSQRNGPRVRLRARLEAGDEVEIELPSDREGAATGPGRTIHLAPKRYGWFPLNGEKAPV